MKCPNGIIMKIIVDSLSGPSLKTEYAVINNINNENVEDTIKMLPVTNLIFGLS